MSTSVIEVQRVGKRYTLGETHEALGERLAGSARRMIGRTTREPRDEFWPLREVSFEVREGELLGLVGPNGAGKSTLLKMLANITYPTEGRIRMRGRVGTLLEVGTGFHPELTGRENVFLAGSILGMRRREIGARYDEIVEFSGVERFLETPVKRYSSGMYVRLGFAIAAHLMPEILLIDEVLAVGDADFQKRCLEKMSDVVENGSTIVFVSHSMPNVVQLCPRALLIDDGGVVIDGDTDAVVATYLSSQGSADMVAASHTGSVRVDSKVPRNGTAEAQLTRIELLSSSGQPTDKLLLGERFSCRLTYDVSEALEDLAFEVGISTLLGQRAVTAQSIDAARPPASLSPGAWTVEVRCEGLLLPGAFTLDGAMHRMSGETVDHVSDTLRFDVINEPVVPDDQYRWPTVRGFARPHSEWHLAKVAT